MPNYAFWYFSCPAKPSPLSELDCLCGGRGIEKWICRPIWCHLYRPRMVDLTTRNPSYIQCCSQGGRLKFSRMLSLSRSPYRKLKRQLELRSHRCQIPDARWFMGCDC